MILNDYLLKLIDISNSSKYTYISLSDNLHVKQKIELRNYIAIRNYSQKKISRGKF